MADSTNRYSAILLEVFSPVLSGALPIEDIIGGTGFEFPRDAITAAATKLGVVLPKNLGDIVYAFRYRAEFPAAIRELAPAGKKWIIAGAGRSKYRARIIDDVRVSPNTALQPIRMPDVTPPNIRAYYPNHVCIPISVQFMAEGDVIAMFRLEEDTEKDSIRVIEEIHYVLSSTWA